jgi:hypothetical protein
MGIVSLLSSTSNEAQKGLAGPIRSLLAVEELQVRAINLAGYVRKEISGVIAALAAKVF